MLDSGRVLRRRRRREHGRNHRTHRRKLHTYDPWDIVEYFLMIVPIKGTVLWFYKVMPLKITAITPRDCHQQSLATYTAEQEKLPSRSLHIHSAIFL